MAEDANKIYWLVQLRAVYTALHGPDIEWLVDWMHHDGNGNPVVVTAEDVRVETVCQLGLLLEQQEKINNRIA